MKKINYKSILLIVLTTFIYNNVFAQQKTNEINVNNITVEQIRSFTKEDLLQLSFEDLIALVKKFKLSSIEELYAMILNPTQSTASKMEEDVFNAPLATTVITSDELEKSGARSIPEALKLAPGLIVREKTNGNYDVHIRGNDYISPGTDFTNTVNSTTLVMIDNRPVYNNFLGATFWENLPLSVNDIEKIEIIYGPSAALYGPNAVSGVIHLITKQPSKEGVSSDIDIQAGTNNTRIANGSFGYKKGKFTVGVSANYNESDRFQDSYYIPMNQGYIEGSEVGEFNSEVDGNFEASEFNDDFSKAKQQGALNLDLCFTPTEKINLRYKGSYQSSTVQTAYMDIGSILSTRESNSFSNSLNINAGKLNGHFSVINGKLNAVQGSPGYEYDYTEINGKISYNLKYKNLIILPGINTNYAKYSDEEYVNIENHEGLLNGSAELGTVQGSLRLDYTAFNKLRIVGAWLQGYFYKPERAYYSYQFASSYKLKENTLIRLVASKSNSSPFVLNTYMNKITSEPLNMENQDGTEPSMMITQKVGNEDLAPKEMQMIEFGIRQKLLKNIQADLSVFYNITKNYSQLEKETYTQQNGTEADPSTSQIITESMQNLDLKSDQLGISASIKYVINEKLNSSLFATYQHTNLEDYKVTDAVLYEELTGTAIDQTTITENPEYISIDHNYTPSFYGGGSVNFSPSKKWNLNTTFYGYSKQESFYTTNQSFYKVTIDPKISLNFKASYQLKDWISVYVNARNALNNTKNEFMYTDKTGGIYLAGININL